MQYLSSIFSANYLRALLILSVAIWVSSCEVEPIDYIDNKEIFSSVEKLEQATLGVYEAWYPEYTIQIASLITDECNISEQNTGVEAIGQSVFRWTFSSDDDEILAPWKNGYKVIGRINNILSGIDTVPLQTEKEKAKVKSIKGELLAIRAFVHFDLYRVYGYSGVYDPAALAVPYIKISKTDNQPSRPDTETFFNDLWQDLKEAESLEPVDHTIRMGITAIECLHARVALYAGKYAEAAGYAGKVIDKFPLTSVADFPLLWKDTKQGEIIFKLKRSNVSAIRPGDLFYNIGADRVLFTPSEQLLELYDSNMDIRYASWYGKNDDRAGEAFSVLKYAGIDENPNLNDVKVFRTAEMYLIRAEAFLKDGNKIALAQQDIHTLRAHRISDYADNSSANTPDELLEVITRERLKELPYEGHRYFDLKRQGKPIIRIAGSNGKAQVLEPSSKHYYIPIPQAEVLANHNIRPNNKGW